MTESNKLSRARLKEKYGARLEALYQEIERNQIQVLSDLVTTDVETSTGDKVLRALKSTLGTEDIVTAQATSFRDLGGDSINAVEFHQLVDKICHVNLPVGFILNPSSTVRDYVAYVEEAISASPESRPVTFAAIHGNNAIDVSQDDLRLDKFLNTPDKKFAYACQGQATVTDSQVVFLTGANGFLGRFLTLEALKQLPRERGKLYCMVRAPHDEAARDRLFGEFEQGDLSMHKHFRDLAAEGRLEVVAGDLMRPRFGMSQEIYGRLAREADTIIHNGALVNHALSYAQLFEPNVLGSVEVIRLALRQRRKAISYVSSVAVVGKVADDHIIREQESAHSLWYRRPVNSGYGVGYGTSKWASEILLEEAYERYQLPMNVFRCGMILAHREFEGQVNVPDFFTRLILSLIYTGMAPQSFYATPAIQTRHPHFDGLPVDFMARSIIGIALHPRHEFATYHVVNDHWDDGISLDTVVDWIIAAGYPIKRVADYGTWYEKFRDRLQRLEASRRQHSSFPIVYQWENPIDLAHETRLDASRYRARVRQLDDDDNHMPHDIPHVNEDLIHKYIADLQELDLIEEPEGSAMVRSPHGERRPRGEDTSREVSS